MNHTRGLRDPTAELTPLRTAQTAPHPDQGHVGHSERLAVHQHWTARTDRLRRSRVLTPEREEVGGRRPARTLGLPRGPTCLEEMVETGEHLSRPADCRRYAVRHGAITESPFSSPSPVPTSRVGHSPAGSIVMSYADSPPHTTTIFDRLR